ANPTSTVAPRVGARIETVPCLLHWLRSGGRSPRGSADRNVAIHQHLVAVSQSLPAWERGSKRPHSLTPSRRLASLPAWERGSKPGLRYVGRYNNESLPAWERGSKLQPVRPVSQLLRVAPRVGAR